MKKNSDKICKNLSWVRKKDYIESSDSLVSIETLNLVNWKIINKFAIDKIKYEVNKYYNKPDFSQIEYMKLYFYPFSWHPIRINNDYELLDGQHRLLFAKEAGLKYIDIFLDKN